LIKHVLSYAELQIRSQSPFSEALSTQLEKLLQFQKRDLSVGFNAALCNNKSLLDIAKLMSTLNLPPKLQIFLRNMLIFQDLMNQENHGKDLQGEYGHKTTTNP
jgi:hypothetical protein